MFNVITILQVFRNASEFMSGQKYPTLSSSLYCFVKLTKKLSEFQRTEDARTSPALRQGLCAAKEKLMKYFDCCTFESEYYYFATCESLNQLLKCSDEDNRLTINVPSP